MPLCGCHQMNNDSPEMLREGLLGSSLIRQNHKDKSEDILFVGELPWYAEEKNSSAFVVIIIIHK